MAIVDKVWVAALTRNKDDAGTDSSVNLTVNINGEDVVDQTFVFGVQRRGQEQGEAGLDPVSHPFPPPPSDPLFDSADLTNSSIRLGIRDDDAWAPQDLLVFGRAGGHVLPLAMETEIKKWASTDDSEGRLSMPIKLVAPGSPTTTIHRVLLLVYTGGGAYNMTDSPIELEIATRTTVVLKQEIRDTTQTDLEEYTANWYMLDALVPFNKGDIVAGGGVKLRILDDDAFLPTQVFLFGLDTPSGRPNEVVELVSLLSWDLGWLSTTASEGKEYVDLPLA